MASGGRFTHNRSSFPLPLAIAVAIAVAIVIEKRKNDCDCDCDCDSDCDSDSDCENDRRGQATGRNVAGKQVYSAPGCLTPSAAMTRRRARTQEGRGGGETTFYAVSYTHLDVYKRQDQTQRVQTRRDHRPGGFGPAGSNPPPPPARRVQTRRWYTKPG